MNRRSFLSLLRLAPIAPMAALAAPRTLVPGADVASVAGGYATRLGPAMITITARTVGIDALVKRACREAASRAVRAAALNRADGDFT